MPLNKLENFIKNTEGRILYVNPSDLDSTDAIENQGNSLTRPFKTIQRALLEAARFSWVKGNDNDIIEKTTILLYPGEHVVDNRPGFGIITQSTAAYAVSPAGQKILASNELSLTSASNFDLTQEDNILYKFNSIHGDMVIVGIDSDEKVEKDKGKGRPINPLLFRKSMLESIRYIDLVLSFNSREELEQLIELYNPDILLIGGDWRDGDVVGRQYAKEVKFFNRVDKYSSTKIIKKINENICD